MSETSSARPAGITMRLLLVLILTCTALTMIATFVVLPILRAREAEARTQSINNLKNIALGMHGFHDSNKRLPFNGVSAFVPATPTQPAYSPNAVYSTFTSGSWGFQIRPYMDSGPWEADPNRLGSYSYPGYVCPGRGLREGGPRMDYHINNYLNDPSNAEKPDNLDARRKLTEITDGPPTTILVGHGNISTADYEKFTDVPSSSTILIGGTFGTSRGGPNWRKGQTPSVTLQRDSEAEPDFKAGGWGGPFAQGALMAMGDCSVRVFPHSMSCEIFAAFLTPFGGEKVELPE